MKKIKAIIIIMAIAIAIVTVTSIEVQASTGTTTTTSTTNKTIKLEKKAKATYSEVVSNNKKNKEKVIEKTECFRLIEKSKVTTKVVDEYKKGSKYKKRKTIKKVVSSYEIKDLKSNNLFGKSFEKKAGKQVADYFRKIDTKILYNPKLNYSIAKWKKNLIIIGGEYFRDEVIFHELGHIFQLVCRPDKTTFLAEREKYVGWNKAYNSNSKEEFFAGSFYEYFFNTAQVKKKMPMTYKHFKQGIKNEITSEKIRKLKILFSLYRSE